MCFEFLYNFCLKYFSRYEELSKIRSKIDIGLHVKCLSFLSDFNETGIIARDFPKYSNNKFYKNPSSGSRVIPYGQMDRLTDMRKLIVAFFQFFERALKQVSLLFQVEIGKRDHKVFGQF